MTAETSSTFLGWCLVFNIAIILLIVLVASVFEEPIAPINSRLI